MPVFHRAIAAMAITVFVLTLVFVAQQIAVNAPASIPVSAPRMAAQKTGPLKTIAASATPGHGVTKVIAKAVHPAVPAPPKKRNL